MSDFSSFLSAAQELPEADRLRLIDVLWDSAPPVTQAPFSHEWARKIERRVAELDAGTAKTVAWSQIQDEALARISHGKGKINRPLSADAFWAAARKRSRKRKAAASRGRARNRRS